LRTLVIVTITPPLAKPIVISLVISAGYTNTKPTLFEQCAVRGGSGGDGGGNGGDNGGDSGDSGGATLVTVTSG
jgi:hypothetical protein